MVNWQALMQGSSEIALQRRKVYAYRDDGKLRRVNFYSPDGELATYESVSFMMLADVLQDTSL